VRGWDVVEGSCFTDEENLGAAQVCLLGATVVEHVFKDEDPLGKRVFLKGLPFRIVGVLDRKGANVFGQDQDDTVLVPFETVRKKMQRNPFHEIDQVLVSATSPSTLGSLRDEVQACLRARHRCPELADGNFADDFNIRDMTEISSAVTGSTRVMTSLLAAIASVSLLVGGIGIMNIMLVSVTERTREIGLRMAVGARTRDILAQFLVEAVALSSAGGAIGVALGVASSVAVSRYAQWPTRVTPGVSVAAIAFSAWVGIFFGFYPALRASRLDPIEALRFE
jgi:putative ABC transport system permease protein